MTRKKHPASPVPRLRQSEPQAPEDEDGTDRDRAREYPRDRNPDAVRVGRPRSLRETCRSGSREGRRPAGEERKGSPTIRGDDGLVGQSQIVPAPGWGGVGRITHGLAGRGGVPYVQRSRQRWPLEAGPPRPARPVVRDEIWIATGRRRMGVGRALSPVPGGAVRKSCHHHR